MSAVEHGVGRLWSRIDAVIDRATDDDLRSHRLEVLAAQRRRVLGLEIPPAFVEQERAAAVAEVTAPLVLERVAAAYDQPAILIKGPEIARLYPRPALRNFWDVDLIVEDAAEAQRALLSAGFEAIGEPRFYLDIHHLQPLRPPGLLLVVELHTRPKWLAGGESPSAEDLLAAARPRGEGPSQILALPPEQHVLLLAAHSWAHEPLRRLRDVVDIALVAAAADMSRVDVLAREWGISRLWSTTRRFVDHLETGTPMPALIQMWARNLTTARERTVLETHVERLSSDFWAYPLATAVARLPRNVVRELRPEDAEPWRAKLRRTGLALRHARRPRSEHDVELDRRNGRTECGS